MEQESLYQVLIEVPREVGGAFAEAVEPHVDSVSWSAKEGFPKAQVFGYASSLPDEEAIKLATRLIAEAVDVLEPNVEISRMPVRNWVVENLKQFPPILAGRFFVHGSEYDDPIPFGKIGLRVPAGAAFGSGDHGSTMGCLLALDRMDHLSIKSALDMGCGSGILAIAMAKRWRIPVIASDIDPISTEVTKENAKINQVAKWVNPLNAVGYAHRDIGSRKYDLIVSNILARPLVRLAKYLGPQLKPGGRAVLSGLLLGDANRIISAHAQQGLQLHHKIILGEWITLVMTKN